MRDDVLRGEMLSNERLRAERLRDERLRDEILRDEGASRWIIFVIIIVIIRRFVSAISHEGY